MGLTRILVLADIASNANTSVGSAIITVKVLFAIDNGMTLSLRAITSGINLSAAMSGITLVGLTGTGILSVSDLEVFSGGSGGFLAAVSTGIGFGSN